MANKFWTLMIVFIISIGIANADWTMFGGSENRTFIVGQNGRLFDLEQISNISLGCPIQSSPVITNVTGTPIAVVNTNCGSGKIFAINLSDNSILWSKDLLNYSMSQPVFYDELVFIGNDATLNWTTGDLLSPAHFYAFDINDGQIVWEKTFNSSIDTSPLILDGVLYFGLDGADSPFLVLNATTGENLTGGKIIYNNTKHFLPGAVMSPFAKIGENIVVGVTDSNWGNNGWLYLINKSGYVVKNITVDGYVKAAPAVYDNKIFLGTGKGLKVYDGNLNIIASYSTEPIQMGIDVNDFDGDGNTDILFGVGDWNNNQEKKVYLLELNGSTLEKIREFAADSYVASVPMVMDIDNDGRLEVLFEDHDNKSYLYNYSDGNLIKQFDIKGTSAPVFYDALGDGVGEVLEGSTDGNFYILGMTYHNANVSVLIVYPNGSSISKGSNNIVLDDGKTALQGAGFSINGSFDSNWGFMLSCIDGYCAGKNLSYWSFYIQRSGDSNFSFSPVGLGPGGSLNSFCWDRNLSDYNGYYCSHDNDTIKIVAVSNPDFAISHVTNVSELKSGDCVEINATVINNGFSSGNATVGLYNGNTLVDEENVTDLDVGNSTNLTFVSCVDKNTTLVLKLSASYLWSPLQDPISLTIRYCGDGVCSSWENSTSCASDCSSGDDGETTTSGGAPLNNTFSDIYSNTIFNPGEKVKFNISRDDLEIKGLEIKLSSNVTKFTIKINKTNETIAEFDGKVYQSVEFSLDGITDATVSGANVTFEVSKNWLDSNNVSYGNIRLFRYHGGKWNALNTSFLRRDGDEYYYKSFTPGFSEFVIGAAEIKNQSNITHTNTTNLVDIGVQPADNTTTEQSTNDNLEIVAGVIILIAVVLFIFFYAPKIKLPKVVFPKPSTEHKKNSDESGTSTNEAKTGTIGDIDKFLDEEFKI